MDLLARVVEISYVSYSSHVSYSKGDDNVGQ